jgi:phosphoglycolate phosphatase-like HAD superfamily hydrolase
VLASSSQGTYLDHYLDLLDAHDLVDAATTAADVETSKPAPDLIQMAKEQPPTPAVAMVGDSPSDAEAGAEIVFASLPEQRDRLEETSLDRGT